MDAAGIGIATFLTTTTLFGLDNPEFVKEVTEQREQGYTWKYIGYTPWSQDKSSSLLIEPGEGFPPYVLFKLTKPEEVKQ